jgi:hypothetical protein
MFAPGDRALVEKMHTFEIEHCYLEKKNLKILRPYFLSPCRKWHKKGSSPRNHSNAEVLRPRVYSNVVGFHGRGFLAMSWVLRPRVFRNIHSRFTHDSLTISHDFRAAICIFYGLMDVLFEVLLTKTHEFSRLRILYSNVPF